MDDLMIGSPLGDLSARGNNRSAGILSDYDPDSLFEHCWRRNSCGSCLETNLPCGWCPTSQSCVPAIAGVFSPISDPKVCPMSSERFELRTKPLSCSVSTLTALTAVTSVLSTLLIVGIVYAVVKYRARLSILWGEVLQSWGQGASGGLGGVDERTSLLRSPREAAADVGRRWSYWVYNTVPEDGGEGPGMVVERSDTVGEEGEAVGGREFEERRERMLRRSMGEV